MEYSASGSSRRASGIFGSVLAALAAAAPATGYALWDDRLELFVQQNVTYDDNVFRLPEGVNTNAAIGAPGKSDTIATTSLGFNLDVPVSLQRFLLSYTWYTAKYDRFGDLDHDGRILRANWLWAVTPRVTGDLGYAETKALSAFSNITAFGNLQARRPDLVTSRMAYANAAWMMTPSWRLHGVVQRTRTEHDEPTRRINNIEATATEAGVSYVTAAENRLGVAVRHERGKSIDQPEVSITPFNNDYDQEGVGVQGRWVLTGASRFDGRFDYIKREYDIFAFRNYKGPTYRVTYTWTPTGKLSIATILARDVAPPEDIASSFALVKSLTIRPDWAITDKVNIRGNFAYGQWEYRGTEFLADSRFEHKVKTAGVSAVWRVLRNVLLTAGYTHERRTSSLSNADYTVNAVSIEGRVGF